mmetsp:Transcript_42582/g.106330  ORF Transcript_42582/g.106330 Transcript_42582/m.106330 type:complete len:89 (-) Transcript_42582:963-1229(-)
MTACTIGTFPPLLALPCTASSQHLASSKKIVLASTHAVHPSLHSLSSRYDPSPTMPPHRQTDISPTASSISQHTHTRPPLPLMSLGKK